MHHYNRETLVSIPSGWFPQYSSLSFFISLLGEQSRAEQSNATQRNATSTLDSLTSLESFTVTQPYGLVSEAEIPMQ